jgi:DnaJ like chaperone protein
MDEDTKIVICLNCNQKNRIKSNNVNNPVCAMCWRELASEITKTNTYNKMELFSTGKITLFTDHFNFKNTRYEYDQVESIKWTWTSMIHLVIKQNIVELLLFLKNIKKPLKIVKQTVYVRPKLVDVAECISEKTFQYRMNRFFKSLNECGEFEYEKTIFYSNGKVKSITSSEIFDLSDMKEKYSFKLTLSGHSPHLKFKKGGFLGPSLNVKIIQDRDVILSLIDYIQKNSREPSQIKEQNKKNKKYRNLLNNSISMLSKVANADGIILVEEIDVVKDFLKNVLQVEKETYHEAIQIFNESINSKYDINYYAEQIKKDYGDEKEILGLIVDILFTLALSDDDFHPEEEKLIIDVEEIFGIKGKLYQQFCSSRSGYSDDDEFDYNSSEEKYFEILGIKSDASVSEIKTAFRMMALKYHPDKNQNETKENQKLYTKTFREITDAYVYLSKSKNF